MSRTAEMLGISRKTLWEKMRRLDIGPSVKAPD
ncbi:MAG: helix-turn-helix domain-containing protein [Burkholderiaceae bacterium]